jgi:hypothetical protein
MLKARRGSENGTREKLKQVRQYRMTSSVGQVKMIFLEKYTSFKASTVSFRDLDLR